jgi:hypothetical protein
MDGAQIKGRLVNIGITGHLVVERGESLMQGLVALR